MLALRDSLQALPVIGILRVDLQGFGNNLVEKVRGRTFNQDD